MQYFCFVCFSKSTAGLTCHGDEVSVGSFNNRQSLGHLGFQGRRGGRLWGRQTGSSSVVCVLSRSAACCSDGGRVSSQTIRSRYKSLAEVYPAKRNLISNHSIINIICTMMQVHMSQEGVCVCVCVCVCVRVCVCACVCACKCITVNTIFACSYKTNDESNCYRCCT